VLLYSASHTKKAGAVHRLFCVKQAYRRRPRNSWILPSFTSFSYFSRLSSLRSFAVRCTLLLFVRLKYRPPRTFGTIPAPCTRFVKRRITFALLSLLFFSTWTLVAICGQENTTLRNEAQAFRQKVLPSAWASWWGRLGWCTLGYGHPCRGE